MVEDYEFVEVMERVVFDYMRNIVVEFLKSCREILNFDWYFECMFEFYNYVILIIGMRLYF